MKIPVFLGEVGITSTSANHIANMAKEMCSNVQTQINNINFVDENITLIGSLEAVPISVATEDLEIKEKLNFIGEAHSLIAWLREAIRAKEELLRHAETDLSDEFEEANPKDFETPKHGHVLTEDEYYDSLPIKERNRYYTLEAKASVYGKAIHPDGAISKALKRAENAKSHPYKYDGEGRDMVITKCESHYSIESLQGMFFELQSEYRSLQAELNGIKHKCELAIKESQAATLKKYKDEYAEYSDKNEQWTIRRNDYIFEKTNELNNLKIVIPDNLKSIYKQVSELSKD
jgi:hypothetical protein